MLTITLNDENQTISVPQSWADIRLGDYEKWFDREPKTPTERVQYIADICQSEVGLFLDSPSQLYDIICETLAFVFEENKEAPNNMIEIDGEQYAIAIGEELSLGEWVDIEAIFENESRSKMSQILAILCRPIGETYDSKTSDLQQEIFAELTMDKALPLLAFFLLQNKKSEMILNHYSIMEQQANQYLQLIRDFAKNGAGTKSLPIWQKIKFYILERYLKNQLSKFSDFSSTK